jgi:aldehyde dehydrogenase (NAD+)
MTVDYAQLFIGGQWVSPTSASRISVIAASTEAVVGSAPEAQEADVDAAVAAAHHALADPTGWTQWSAVQRADAMERLAAVLERRSEDIVQRVSVQNGMPVAVGRQLEGAFPVALLRYYAGLCRDTSAEELRPGFFGGQVLVRREPIGVVAAIVPWNFPQTLAAFKYAPALAAGCALVIKPSPEAVLDSYVFAECVIEAGIPAGVINIVPGGRDVGAYLVSHPDVDKVSFTGSTAAGKSIGEVCGRLLRPVTLELGGKSAAVILDDADLNLEEVAEELFAATLLNNGQTCFLGTRVLAPRSRYAEIVDLFTDFAKSLTVGDSLDESTQIGPMATAAQRERVESFIAKGRGEGARITTGGARPAGRDRGWFIEPTVFADVDNQHATAQQEIFGPVLSVIGYADDSDAINIANDSDYGLAGTVWTSDVRRGLSVAGRIQTGTIGVNRYLPDPVGPFGGVKASGMGRELGPEGLTAFQQLKSFYLD